MGLFILSYKDIQQEAKAAAEAAAALAAEAAEGEEGGAPPADGAAAPTDGAPPPADGEEVKIEIKEDSPWTLLVNCEGGQKVNFANNLMVFIGQIMKNGYDSYASSQLQLLEDSDGYVDLTGLYKLNKFTQLMDSMIICVSSISL